MLTKDAIQIRLLPSTVYFAHKEDQYVIYPEENKSKYYSLVVTTQIMTQKDKENKL
jgi:hypothetical protein